MKFGPRPARSESETSRPGSDASRVGEKITEADLARLFPGMRERDFEDLAYSLLEATKPLGPARTERLIRDNSEIVRDYTNEELAGWIVGNTIIKMRQRSPFYIAVLREINRRLEQD